jgi:hypothetical protein
MQEKELTSFTDIIIFIHIFSLHFLLLLHSFEVQKNAIY